MIGAFFMRTSLTTAYFRNAEMRRWVADTLRDASIDRVVIFSTAMTPYLLDLHEFPFHHVIFDMVDIDSDKWRQYADSSFGPRSWVYRREARLFFGLERRAAGAFAATLLVSPFESITFAGLAPETRDRLHSLSNGVDLNYFGRDIAYASPFAVSEIPIVMTGRMDYRPNVDAALWFAEKVLPMVRTALPAARFYAVGAQPSAKLKSLQKDDVVVTGTVDDVRPYLANAVAVVAPLRIARGIQNKVLEAMAMQKPVIATTPATRALGVRAGVELWIEDEPERFAASVIAAITGPDAARIAAAGYRHVEANYDWGRNLGQLDVLLAGPSSPGRGTPPPTVGRQNHFIGAPNGTRHGYQIQ